MRAILMLAAVLLAASCSVITPTRPNRLPNGALAAMCATHIARAHVALAGPHDPERVGMRAAEHAAAMGDYHSCLARVER
jgi:hypothetical protein